MFGAKSLSLTLFLFISTHTYAQFTDVINSNRPGESMGAFSVGKTVIQAELGFYGFREKHSITAYEANGFGTELQVRYGAFFEQLEFILDAQYQSETYKDTRLLTNERHSAFKEISIGAKYLIYDPLKNYEQKPNLYSWKANHKFSWRAFIPAVGAYAGLNLALSNGVFDRPRYRPENKISPTVGVLTQNQFGRFVLVINVMAEKLATERESFDYVVTLTRGFNQRWSGFLEHQGYISDYYSDAVFRVGAAWLAKQNVQIDASIGTNIKNTPSILVGGVGLSWRFDANYNEVYLRIPEKEKSKDDKKKDKKKDKAKKRLDEIENGGGTEPAK
jgi:hypothetical protein